MTRKSRLRAMSSSMMVKPLLPWWAWAGHQNSDHGRHQLNALVSAVSETATLT